MFKKTTLTLAFMALGYSGLAQAAVFEGLSDCIEVSSDTNVGTGNYDYSGLPNGGVCVQKVKNNNGQTVYYFGLTQDAAEAMNSIDDSSANSVLYDDPNNKDKVTFNPDGDGSVVSGVQDGSVAEGSTEAVNGSQLWEVQQQAIKAKTTVSAGNNIEVTASLNEDGSTNYQVATAKDVIFDKTTVGSVITDSTYVDENGNTIMTGVGNGSLTQGSTEAVNGGQLWQTNQRVTINENQITSIINGELGLTQTDGKTTTIDKNGTSTVINVAGANGDRIISGVADGVAANDVATKGQLDAITNRTDGRLNALRDRIDDNRKIASQGIAGVAAMDIEYPEQKPGDWATGVGLGTYDGQTALGVGINYLTSNGKTKIYGGYGQSLNSGSRGVGKVGISFVF